MEIEHKDLKEKPINIINKKIRRFRTEKTRIRKI